MTRFVNLEPIVSLEKEEVANVLMKIFNKFGFSKVIMLIQDTILKSNNFNQL